MKNLFKRVLIAIFIVACVIFGVNESICNAEPLYTDEYIPDAHVYRATAVETFKSNRTVTIAIHKGNAIYNYDPSDFYFYLIEILQRTDQNPFNIKSITIMSEWDSVEIPADNPNRTKGLNFITDRISYLDTGKVNRVIESVWSKMLIRITTTNGVVYDFYPSEEYISDTKRVADWASR